ncbi:MAG: carbohydrate ABC transporter permease [Geminicoccaceae bacterium]
MATNKSMRLDPALQSRLGLGQRLGLWLARSWPLFALYAALTFLVLWTVLPILWAVSASLKQPLEVYESTSLLPKSFSLSSYWGVLTMDGFGRWLLNSTLVTVVATIVPLFLSILAAYAFATYAFRFRHILLFLFLAPRIIPRVSLIVPLNDWLSQLGLLNTYWVLFITYTASAIPLSTWILTGFFAAVPRELEEQAVIDGANLWQRLWYIMLPVAWPGVITAAVLCIREAWNEFPFVLSFVNQTDMRTLPYQLYLLRDAMGIQDWALYNAFTIMSVLPLILVYILLERRVVESLISGSIK